jgi:hypothetical protein
MVPYTLSKKEEYHEKPSSKIQYLWGIFVNKSSLETKIREAYVVNPFAQHYFMEILPKWKIRAFDLDYLIKNLHKTSFLYLTSY